ncbi:MAG: hypothetical protein IJ049_05985, partial [Oscillospiraceae bacterium]|nr:hypothetical protein [Oscillospiraceae bacterium]
MALFVKGFRRRFFLGILPAHLPGDLPDGGQDGVCLLAHRIAQHGQDVDGVELCDVPKILRRKVVSGVKPTASQQHIFQAGVHGIAEPDGQIALVQTLQKAAVRLLHQLRHGIVHLVYRGVDGEGVEQIVQCQILRLRLKAVCDPLNDIMLRSRGNAPEFRRSAVRPADGVAYVKDVFQSGALSTGVNEGNAPCTTHDSPVKSALPQLIGGAGSSLRLLGVDEHLLLKRVTIHSGCGIQIEHPRLRGLGDARDGFQRQFLYFLIGFRQSNSPRFKRAAHIAVSCPDFSGFRSVRCFVLEGRVFAAQLHKNQVALTGILKLHILH